VSAMVIRPPRWSEVVAVHAARERHDAKGSAMSVSPDTRPLAPASVTSALGVLRAGGHRISAARRLVLEALFAADGPVSADRLAGGLDGRLPGSDLASLYRNLDTLAEAGIVEHLHVPHGPGLYVLTGRADGWAACEACGRVEGLDRSAAAWLREAVRGTTGLEAGLAHFPLVGVCRGCAEAQS
jgi:Fur family transcriptional regulator, ferric uptake regulator